MGKDADCCDACRMFGDAPEREIAARDVTPTPGFRERVRIVAMSRGDAREYVPTGERFTVGRATTNDIALADGALSRRQCTLFFDGDTLYVEDSRSTCGTFVDGAKINGPTPVGEGSRIVFGNSSLLVTTR